MMRHLLLYEIDNSWCYLLERLGLVLLFDRIELSFLLPCLQSILVDHFDELFFRESLLQAFLVAFAKYLGELLIVERSVGVVVAPPHDCVDFVLLWKEFLLVQERLKVPNSDRILVEANMVENGKDYAIGQL